MEIWRIYNTITTHRPAFSGSYVLGFFASFELIAAKLSFSLEK